ncbi:DUF1833 family protein [Acinetobacter sp. 187]|uniref:DUF1833 family protein n=1 Tax=Acinetobacter lanii TaxID=2715163 RepID=UPI00140D5C4E|nr:DUF1833 family protein [Acinetobacter lanii]NHC02318.1 DUF1833 family protein [Acinetobacter lanii]
MEITDAMLAVLDQSAGPVGLVECIEITHSKWGAYRYVMNSSSNLVLRHEDGSSYTYTAAPIEVTKSSDENNLDQEITFTLNDLGEVIPDLLDLIIYDDEIELPQVAYRAYLTGNYNAPTIIAKGLELTGVTRDKNGSQCEASAPGLNESGNGEVYSASIDPSLIGFY